ncbi:MAG: type II toxin-antitoxin system RelE/ParE family toxin [Devosiaceae bacterium]|nr:type II toxin-antitoxin system RelE/ParE family toxin [Devosiaceae bacterium]
MSTHDISIKKDAKLKLYISEINIPIDPKLLGKQLKGSKLGYFWHYRVGSYRLICEIQHDKLIVLVLMLGHRKDVYL